MGPGQGPMGSRAGPTEGGPRRDRGDKDCRSFFGGEVHRECGVNEVGGVCGGSHRTAGAAKARTAHQARV